MDWFKFHLIWGSGLDELSDAEAGRFIKSLCAFAETGEIGELSGNERFILSIALKQMKQDAERSAKISSARAEAGRAGGLSSKQTEAKQANVSNCLQTEANENDEKQNQANALLRIKNKNKNKEEEKEQEVINKAAAAAGRETGKKPKLTPDQPEFWKCAFGPEADRARAFSEVSGIIPIGTEFGRWQKDLRAYTEAGISIPQMVLAVQKVRRDGKYPIKAPGTVFTEARNLSAVPAAVSQKSTADYLDDLSWEGCDE